jgi:hypothetical protein
MQTKRPANIRRATTQARIHAAFAVRVADRTIRATPRQMPMSPSALDRLTADVLRGWL